MKKAGSIINNYFKCENFRREAESLDYTGIWQRITGKNIERCTRPVALKNGTLFVEVEDSIWLYQLTLLKDNIISDMNAISGDIKVTNIIFRNTGISLSGKIFKNNNFISQEKKDSNVQEQKITVEEELSGTDLENIKKLVSFVPNFCQEGMDSLISSFFRLQHWKSRKGAKICTRCSSLYLENENIYDKELLCHICKRETNPFHSIPD